MERGAQKPITVSVELKSIKTNYRRFAPIQNRGVATITGISGYLERNMH